MGIFEDREKRPRELSVGMRTRTAFVRGLITDPQYLFLDEPFASVDIGNRWNAYKVVCEERRAAARTTIMTTHSVPEAMLLADCVVVLSRNEARTEIGVFENEAILTSDATVEDAPKVFRQARRAAGVIEDSIAVACMKETQTRADGGVEGAMAGIT